MQNIHEPKMSDTTLSRRKSTARKFKANLQHGKDVSASRTASLLNRCVELTKPFPSLIPFELRRRHFHSSLGWRPGDRFKVQVSRDNILDAAAHAMKTCCDGNALLEVEYYGEIGTGIGPTLEFWALVSREFQKTVHGMWRQNQSADHDHGKEFSDASLGLFPRPYLSNANGSDLEKVNENFSLLGQVMAKCVKDRKLLDLPLSKAFYKLILDKELTFTDIQSVDPGLGSALKEMDAIVKRKKVLSSVHLKGKWNLGSLRYRGAKIEDLCIDFTLPGYSDVYPLKDEGGEVVVTLDNLEEYIEKVVDATIKTGVMPQVEAFKNGFNKVFPISLLQPFTESEMDLLFCGEHNLWDKKVLKAHIKFDHGYTSHSVHIKYLLEIMLQLSPKEQRAFLQFVTGSPRLPIGGLSALNPTLTVVRKEFLTATDDSTSSIKEQDLPSAMTCANYFKLPPYSTKEMMHERILYAINEGQGSFHFS